MLKVSTCIPCPDVFQLKLSYNVSAHYSQFSGYQHTSTWIREQSLSGQLKKFLLRGMWLGVKPHHIIPWVKLYVNIIMGLCRRLYNYWLQTRNTLLNIGRIYCLRLCALSGLYCVLAPMWHRMKDSSNSWDEALPVPLFCQVLFC